METRHLGNTGLVVSAMGLGCMGMSYGYGPAADKAEMVTLIRTAFERGVTFFDTAEVYGRLSEAGVATIRRAHAALPLAAIQSEYSMFWRRPDCLDISKNFPTCSSGGRWKPTSSAS